MEEPSPAQETSTVLCSSFPGLNFPIIFRQFLHSWAWIRSSDHILTVLLLVVMLSVSSLRTVLSRTRPFSVGEALPSKPLLSASCARTTGSCRVRKSLFHTGSIVFATSYVDRRPSGSQFHVSDAGDDFESDLPVDGHVDEDLSSVVTSPPRGGSSSVAKTIRFSARGPAFDFLGFSESGEKIYRPQGLDASVPTKMVRKVRLSGRKRSMKQFESVLVQEVMKDVDFDRFVAPETPSALDFSLLFSKSSDLASLFDTVAQKVGFKFIRHQDALVQAFESCVKSPSQQIAPMDASTYAIGKELLEMHVLNALSSTYPHLPPNALIQFTQSAVSPTALSKALLSLKLEPFIQLVPNTPLSKFQDPAEACLQLAANAYLCLLGVVYLEHGFESASKVLFHTLHLAKITPDELKKLHLLEQDDAKKTLFNLLRKLRFPLPQYEMEAVQKDNKVRNAGLGNRFTAIVKSGHKVIGRGIANSKPRAEARAASDALLLHWSMQTPL